MKKFIVLLLLAAVLMAGAQSLKAESVFLNFGVMTADDFLFDPFFWYFGISFNFQLAEILYITPEANIMTWKFKFDTFWFDPAVMLNIKLDDFFFGAGINKMWAISGGDWYDSSEWLFKINAGFAGGNVRLVAFAKMAFSNMFKDMLIGAQFGIGF